MSSERSLSRRTVACLTVGASAAGALAIGDTLGAFDIDDGGGGTVEADRETIALPDPETDGETSVEAAIATRRSRREYSDEPLTLGELGQLLWAAQGITRSRAGAIDLRAAPSAGATYPLTVSVAVDEGGVDGVGAGVLRYDSDDHTLQRRGSESIHGRLEDAALEQSWVGSVPVDLVVSAIDERTTDRYGERGCSRYVPMEAGHVGENIYLQAEALDLATVVIGAFRDEDVRSLVGLSEEHRPLYVIPVGHRP